MRNIPFIVNRKIWYIVSSILVVTSIVSIIVFGLHFGLDFTGGSLLEVSYAKLRPDIPTLTNILMDLGQSSARVQPSGELSMIIRLPEIPEETHQYILSALAERSTNSDKENTINELRFESFGSSLGGELKSRSVYAIFLVLIAIIIYISLSFRKVTHPVSSWKFGMAAVIALIHDALIVIGAFSLLGMIFGTEINSYFVTALLTLLGFSVHDTIVTIDRVREKVITQRGKPFDELVDISINETLARSINTSATTLFSLIAIYFFGGESIKDFSLALIIGIIVGTYSSIFIAAPLLVTFHLLSKRSKA